MTPVLELDAGGVRVLLRPNPAHEALAARFYVRGGAANTSLANAGSESLYARVARRGTARYPKEKLNATLARVGAELGAHAGHDATVFTLRCLRRHLDVAWDAFTDVVLEPLLLDDEVAVVRGQMQLEHRQAIDSPDGALVERARRQVYSGHPYAADPQGNETSLQTLESSGVRVHMRRVCTRSNVLLVFAGNLSAADAERCAASFRHLPAGDGATPLPPRHAYARATLAVEPRELPTTYVLGQFAAPALRDEDHAATWIAMSVLRDRFFEEVRTKRNLSYAPSASLGADAANLGSIYVTAADVATTLGVMHAEIRRLAHEPMSAEDLEHKVRTFVTRYALQNEGSQAQAAFIAAYELWGGGWRRAEDMVSRLQAVTPAAVAAAVARTIRNVQYTVVGDADGADPALFVDP